MKNIKNYIVIAIIFIAVFSCIIIQPLENLDEIWNYNFARNIANGLVPYKDFNMVQTPLLPILCGIILKVISNQLIIMRILAAILLTTILFTTYKLMLLLCKQSSISFIITAIIGILFKENFCIDYNYAILCVVLIILYQELKNYNINKTILCNNKKQDILIGILAGICITLKQSTGLIISIIVIMYKAIEIRNKQDLGLYLKIAVSRIIGILIPCITMLIYLCVTGAIEEFINYAILGVSTFTNSISYMRLLKGKELYIKILAIAVPIILLILLITYIFRGRKKSKNKTILILLVYSISILITMYPIADKIHFLIGSYITIISGAYIVYTILKYVYTKIPLTKKEKICKILGVIICLIIFWCVAKISIDNIYNYFYNMEKENDFRYFNHIFVPDYLKERIQIIDNYIIEQEEKGKQVYILDAEAAVYMIPLNRYNKDYDMFLKGNLGIKSQEEVIKNIQREENALFLVKSENYTLNWQTPEEVINYIKQNMAKVNEISIYNVYENK